VLFQTLFFDFLQLLLTYHTYVLLYNQIENSMHVLQNICWLCIFLAPFVSTQSSTEGLNKAEMAAVEAIARDIGCGGVDAACAPPLDKFVTMAQINNLTCAPPHYECQKFSNYHVVSL
jgi:hypothetical protein